MSWSVRVIASPALAAGFRLAGLRVEEVAGAREAAAQLSLTLAEPGVGVLLIEQRLLDALPEPARRLAERRAVPILVPIPRPRWDGTKGDAESLILELLRQAIGYRVRLQ